MNQEPSFKAGIYLLENLTSGMYTDPLAILREYIQNGVDSIDLTIVKETNSQFEIRIELDPIERRISIWDNGQGIPAALAQEILSNIGSSNKTTPGLRGFRGIGRLGGIAFSDKVLFRTKAENENVESIQEWDCRKLRESLGKHKYESLFFNDLFQSITAFSHKNSKKGEERYFEVTLLGVSSFRNYIFDINRVKRYLSQVAPVPFKFNDFSYGYDIDKYLQRKLNNYRTYNIILNGEKIYKPYRDKVKITKGGFDNIKGINFFELQNEQNEMISCGWYGLREQMLGSIIKGDDTSGIRVRAGNIMIGDEHLVDGCFREHRFNSYVIGEIHVEFEDLNPNSRRDDFVDNKSKSIFYNAVERKIGLPISKEIRLRSKIRSESRVKNAKSKETVEQSIEPLKIVYKELIADQRKVSENTSETLSKSRILEALFRECNDCPKVTDVLDKFMKNPS